MFRGKPRREKSNMLQSMRDAPGTQRQYETIFILRPDTNQEGIQSVNTRIRGVIDSMGGRLIKLDNWGKRKLAYEVKKQLKGIYLYWQYLTTPGTVEEIERNLRMLDSVIRYITVKVDEDVDTGARPSEIDETSFEKAAQTAADEEDMFLSRGGDDLSSGDDDDIFGADDDGDVIPGSKKPVPEAAPAPAADATEEKE
jgi:small subunit ribosomal protein S6